MGCIEKIQAFTGEDDSDDSLQPSQSHEASTPSAASKNATAVMSTATVTNASQNSTGGHRRSRRDFGSSASRSIGSSSNSASAPPVKTPDMAGMLSMFGGGNNKTSDNSNNDNMFNASNLPVMCS